MTWENIDNKAEYKASGKGISYSTGAGVPLNALGLLSNMGPTVKDKEGTTTQSAVSQGTITITNKENQTQDIEKQNRNTEDSLNKLKEIFDKTKVEEKQELIHMMNIVGNQIIHEAADHYGWKEGSTEKTLSPWSHRRTDRNHERRECIVRSRIGKRERICFGISLRHEV